MIHECLSFKHYTIVLITHDENVNRRCLWLMSFFLCVHSEFPGFPLSATNMTYDYHDFSGFLDAFGDLFVLLFHEENNILLQNE